MVGIRRGTYFLGGAGCVFQSVGVFLLLAFVPLFDGADIADDAGVGFGFLEIGQFRFCLVTGAALCERIPVCLIRHIFLTLLQSLSAIMTRYRLHTFFLTIYFLNSFWQSLAMRMHSSGSYPKSSHHRIVEKMILPSSFLSS